MKKTVTEEIVTGPVADNTIAEEVAIAVADAGLVAAVIEMETTRAVTTIRRDPRVPTPVDVALVGGVIVRWIAAMRAAAARTAAATASAARAAAAL